MACRCLARFARLGRHVQQLQPRSNPYVFRQILPITSRLPAVKFLSSEASPQPASGLIDGTAKWINRLFGGDNEESQIVAEEERNERQKLLDRVYEMYFAKPPQEPDLNFYKEAFDLLIKYNDRVGVETVWRILEGSKVVPDEELISKVEDFLIEARERSWF